MEPEFAKERKGMPKGGASTRKARRWESQPVAAPEVEAEAGLSERVMVSVLQGPTAKEALWAWSLVTSPTQAPVLPPWFTSTSCYQEQPQLHLPCALLSFSPYPVPEPSDKAAR